MPFQLTKARGTPTTQNDYFFFVIGCSLKVCESVKMAITLKPLGFDV